MLQYMRMCAQLQSLVVVSLSGIWTTSVSSAVMLLSTHLIGRPQQVLHGCNVVTKQHRCQLRVL
jgi:hypothetical protein